MIYNSLGRKGLIDIEKEILKAYDDGLLIKEICVKLNTSRSNVHIYLKKSNRQRNHKHNFDKSSFSTFTPESCYWAGFIAADGGISKLNTHLRVTLNVKDASHILKLLNFANDSHPYIVKGERNFISPNGKLYHTKFARADINSVDIVKDLSDNFNITPAKSLTLKPPVNIPGHLAVHYIRGYFDGDGSIYWNKSHKCAIFNISSGSTELLEWIAGYISDQVEYKFSEKAFTLRKNNTIHFIGQPGKSAQHIFDWLYKDSTPETRLDRKYDRYLKYI